MTNTRNRTPGWVISGLACVVLTAACSNTGEDVRVTLCKDLTRQSLGPESAITWLNTSTDMSRGEQLSVKLSFRAGENGKASQSACFYRYNAVDETALTVANPAAAYSTSPYSMTLDGRTIRNPALARLIKDAMLKQGREFIDRAQQGVEDAARAARDRLNGAETR